MNTNHDALQSADLNPADEIKKALAVQAAAILSGRPAAALADQAALVGLTKALEKHKEFGLARRVLAHARQAITVNPLIYRTVFQKSALYTYKDPDLPVD